MVYLMVKEVDFKVIFWFRVMDTFAGRMAGTLPIIMLIGRFTRICPKGLEATGISILMAIFNSSFLLNGVLAGW